MDVRGTGIKPPALELHRDDVFVAIDLPGGNQRVLLLGPSRQDIVVLIRQNSQLAKSWQTVGGAIDPATPSVMGAWPFKPDDRFMLLGLGGQRDLIVANASGSELAALN